MGQVLNALSRTHFCPVTEYSVKFRAALGGKFGNRSPKHESRRLRGRYLPRLLADRRDQSTLHLSKYALDAGKRLANCDGDLKNARAFQQITGGHASLFPEDQPHTKIDVSVLSFAAIKPVETSE
jgi:hypothetical protein